MALIALVQSALSPRWTRRALLFALGIFGAAPATTVDRSPLP
jgi:hypothetical protein